MDEPWQQRAACADLDPEVFFVPGDDLIAVNAAKRICNRCPVMNECLKTGLAVGTHGIWGGLTETERRRLGAPSRNQIVRQQRRQEVEHLTRSGLSAHEIADRLAISAREVTRVRSALAVSS